LQGRPTRRPGIDGQVCSFYRKVSAVNLATKW
jgi:hypothetical protein